MRLWTLLPLAAAGGCVLALLHRPALPHPAAHGRTVPAFERLAPIEACWVELRRRGALTSSAVLVRHPAGDVLIDAGAGRHFDDEIRRAPWLLRIYEELYSGALRPRLPLPELLAGSGLDPSRISFAILTHAHPDHAGGLLDLPAPRVLAGPDELAMVAALHGNWSRHLLPAHAEFLATHAQPIPFRDLPYEVFDRSADLFGDGTLVAVPLPGHTPGSLGVFVNLSPSRRLLLLGDAADTVGEILKNRGKRALFALTDIDREEAGRTVGRLSLLHREAPEVALVPGHDRPAWVKAFGENAPCLSR